ncbi:hypothetical protein COCON_G00132800 [Conger conger]|uniref:Uncharacterized protein n=1 Tax=Conger conger TaxID=82655 RepID=A0A9Q1DE58_CONCO|nr:hypothetical protein COCON_G00132800 [Conger conger]
MANAAAALKEFPAPESDVTPLRPSSDICGGRRHTQRERLLQVLQLCFFKWLPPSRCKACLTQHLLGSCFSADK